MKKPTNPPKPCSECAGSGKCAMCNGTGHGKEKFGWYGKCPACWGTGLCITCQAPAVEVKK